MTVVGVRLEENGKTYYYDSNNFELNIGDNVIVETEKFTQFATVVSENVNRYDAEMKLKKTIRFASKKDDIIHQKNITDSKNAVERCREIVEKLNLDMHILDAFYTFDRKQLLFQFTADNRVDFRNLAKELASIYRTRIELRQIGVRDKAKHVGGIGICGRELCCKGFLKDMDSVSINMAKNQNLALNPNKINGCCGRLLCCLKYEDSNYCESRKKLPKIGSTVKTEFGNGKVVSLMVCEGKYKVDIPNHGVVEISVENAGCK